MLLNCECFQYASLIDRLPVALKTCTPVIKSGFEIIEAPFLDFHLTISDGFVSSKIYDKRDDFDFDIVNFPFIDGDIPRATSYGVYISQLIRFARVSSHVVDFNTRTQRNFSNKVIGITNSVKRFKNSVDVTMNWFQNLIQD